MTDTIIDPKASNTFFKLKEQLFLLAFKQAHLKTLEALIKKLFIDYFLLDNFVIVLDSKRLKNNDKLHCLYLHLQDYDQKIRLEFTKQKSFTKKNILDIKQIKKPLLSIISKVFLKAQKKELFDQWKLIFDSISTPLCLSDPFAKIYTANKKFLKESKKTYAAIVGQDSFLSFFKPNFETYKIINKNTKNNFNIFEVQAKTKDSTMYYYEVLNQNFKINVSFQEDISLYFFRDISQQKKIEKELLTQSQKVELGLISSSIAHELNNPVASMLIYIDLLSQALSSSAESLTKRDRSQEIKNLQEIKTAILKCAQIIKSLLSFAKK